MEVDLVDKDDMVRPFNEFGYCLSREAIERVVGKKYVNTSEVVRDPKLPRLCSQRILSANLEAEAIYKSAIHKGDFLKSRIINDLKMNILNTVLDFIQVEESNVYRSPDTLIKASLFLHYDSTILRDAQVTHAREMGACLQQVRDLQEQLEVFNSKIGEQSMLINELSSLLDKLVMKRITAKSIRTILSDYQEIREVRALMSPEVED